MEIQRTTTKGKSTISATLKLTYDIYAKGDKKELVGEVRKDDEVAGRFNASNNGILGFSLQESNGLTTDEIKQAFLKFAEDAASALQ
jgi:hypothetical protein